MQKSTGTSQSPFGVPGLGKAMPTPGGSSCSKENVFFSLFAASPGDSLSIWCFVGLVSAWHNEQVTATNLVWFARVRCVGRREKNMCQSFACYERT